MKIRELIEKTGVSKETVHYYIREGVLQKPRKTGKNTADYSQSHVDQIRTIKSLRDNYFLPIPVIKKLIKKQKTRSRSENFSFQFLIENFRPLDQLIFSEISGRQAFMNATGLSERWLSQMIEWEIIAAGKREKEDFFSQDDVIIGKLIADMDRIGIGPRDGFNPEELKNFTSVLRAFVAKNLEHYMQAGWDKMSQEELVKKGSQSTELMSLFFYHIYRKLVREEYRRYTASHTGQADSQIKASD
ncbi:MAG: MerR family transcriptional regulator [Desulfobacteraceae bacterium]|nr:MerR family transcriptional regulator [Desulfobacteraceae bacterium]